MLLGDKTEEETWGQGVCFYCDLVFVLNGGNLERVQVLLQSINREAEAEGRAGKNHSTDDSHTPAVCSVLVLGTENSARDKDLWTSFL